MLGDKDNGPCREFWLLLGVFLLLYHNSFELTNGITIYVDNKSLIALGECNIYLLNCLLGHAPKMLHIHGKLTVSLD